MAAYRSHPHLYEINTWAWLTELSRTQGRKIRLGEVPDQEWDTLQAREGRKLLLRKIRSYRQND